MLIRTELETRELDTLSPYASFAAKSAGRVRPEEECDIRTCYMKNSQAVFAERLTELLLLATQRKNVLGNKEIDDCFRDITFTAEDEEKTIDFLEANGVDVLRMDDTENDDEVLLLSDDEEAEIGEEEEVDMENIDLTVPEGVSIEDPVRMHEIVEKKIPIIKRTVSTNEAIELFKRHHMVSATLSPLEAEEEAALWKPKTLPPKFIIAASKESLVRVLGS